MTGRRPGLEVIEEPQNGTAGFGVRYRDADALGSECAVTVEQLWPNGDAEPVHIPEEHLSDLIYELMTVHMELMDDAD